MKNIDDRAFDDMARRANIDPEELRRASDSGNIDDFINKNLSPDASRKLQQVLSDQSATEKLLSTPQARELINKLLNR